MSDPAAFDDDLEEEVDLQLWRKLLAYTLHYRRTAIALTVIAIGMAASDLCFPLLTGKLIADIEANGSDVDLPFYAWSFAGLTVIIVSFIWGFILCAGKIRTHVSHDIRRDAFGQLQELSFRDRKSTRLNSSHVVISYAVLCLEKKKKT